MTKRFINHDDTILDTEGEQLISTDEIVNKMNELHEKNERLKEYNNKLMKQPLLFDVQTIPNNIMDILEANTQLEKENEQFKKALQVAYSTNLTEPTKNTIEQIAKHCGVDLK